MSNAQKAFLSYGHTLVTTLIPPASGSTISDSNNGGWVRLSAVFDGTTSQTQAQGGGSDSDGATTNGLTYYVGKDWGAGQAHRVTKLILYGPNNNGTMLSTGAGTILLEGSNDGSSWTSLDSFSGGAANTVVTRTTTITAVNAYRYHRVSTTGNGSNGCCIAELQFYRDL